MELAKKGAKPMVIGPDGKWDLLEPKKYFLFSDLGLWSDVPLEHKEGENYNGK
jgi:hypothetical protein